MAKRCLTCAVAVLMLGAGSESEADPITVTGGSLVFGQGDPPFFHLIFENGGHFSGDFFFGGMTSNFPVNATANCSPPCQPGATVNFASEWQQQSIDPGGAVVNGQEFRPFYDLSFSFQAGDATLPPRTDQFEPLLVTVPFTMAGSIALFLDQARTRPLLSDTIAGQGTASALFAGGFEQGWNFQSQSYRFEPAAAPIPEPGTVTLLVTGVVAAILLQRKRAGSRRWLP